MNAESESRWIASIDTGEKLRFLAMLAHQLTIAARSSYAAGTDTLSHPKRLRAINEIQHRVTACVSQMLAGNERGEFAHSIASDVFGAEPDVQPYCVRAWEDAKRYLA